MSSRREATAPVRLTYKFFVDAMDAAHGNADIWWIDASFIEKLRPSADAAQARRPRRPPRSRLRAATSKRP